MQYKKCPNPNCGKSWNSDTEAFADGWCADCGCKLPESEAPKPEISRPEPASEGKPSKPKKRGPRIVPRVDRETSRVLLDGEDAEKEPEPEQPLLDKPGWLKEPEPGPQITVAPSTVRPRLIVIVQGEEKLVHPIEFDEIKIGRKSSKATPDVDLSAFDPESHISREHVLLFRQEGKYFARNISQKNAVHVNGDPLAFDQQQELSDGDVIFLSGLAALVFRLGEGEEG